MIARPNYLPSCKQYKIKTCGKKPAIQTARLPEQASNSIPRNGITHFFAYSETESALLCVIR